MNLVAPGWIPTERHADVSVDELEAYRQEVPMQKMGNAAEWRLGCFPCKRFRGIHNRTEVFSERREHPGIDRKWDSILLRI